MICSQCSRDIELRGNKPIDQKRHRALRSQFFFHDPIHCMNHSDPSFWLIVQLAMGNEVKSNTSMICGITSIAYFFWDFFPIFISGFIQAINKAGRTEAAAPRKNTNQITAATYSPSGKARLRRNESV